jgi:hypothetical protein
MAIKSPMSINVPDMSTHALTIILGHILKCVAIFRKEGLYEEERWVSRLSKMILESLKK